MDERDESLKGRLERMEAIIGSLQRRLTSLEDSLRLRGSKFPPTQPPWPPTNPRSTPNQNPSDPPRTAEDSRPAFDIVRDSEYWLNKIGIGLLLFGVAFLFKYSVDQQWLTPTVRVGLGLALGILLLVIGSRVHATRRHFSQVLMGGGIATFYISWFAAFQFYSLVGYSAAFIFMVSVTLIAFLLSVHYKEEVLSVIGTIGGLATPFLLYVGEGSVSGLVGYTCVILLGTAGIYMRWGWRLLLWASFIGFWLVFRFGFPAGAYGYPGLPLSDSWLLQTGIVLGWLAFWAVPVYRDILEFKYPNQWPRPSSGSIANLLAEQASFLSNRHVHLISVLTPLFVLSLSKGLWSLSDITWGWITLGAGILYGVVSWSLWSRNLGKRLGYSQALIAVLLATIALALLLDGNALFFGLAAEATTVIFIAHRFSDRIMPIGAHALFAVIALRLFAGLVGGNVKGVVVFNATAMTDLAVIALALAASTALQSRDGVLTYRLVAHLALLGWFWRELSTLTNGNGYVTIAWGVYTLVLLIYGLRRDVISVLSVAMGTLLVVVGKLFLVDLVQLEVIWRILLFLCFGGVFLVTSYYWQSLRKSS